MAAWCSPAPAALQWQDNGELAAQDLFALICRLRDVEPAEYSHELWRLSQKLPEQIASALTTQPSAD